MNLWRKHPSPSTPQPGGERPQLPAELWIPPSRPHGRPWLHLLLFVLTLISVMAAGAM